MVERAIDPLYLSEQYGTEERLASALADLGSWHEIVRRGLGDRGLRPPVAGADDDAHGVEEADEFDAFRVPRPLWERLQVVTETAYAAGRAVGNNHPGTHGVGALLDFVGSDAGRSAWEKWLAQCAGLRAAA